jgi:hypothetical protein
LGQDLRLFLEVFEPGTEEIGLLVSAFDLNGRLLGGSSGQMNRKVFPNNVLFVRVDILTQICDVERARISERALYRVPLIQYGELSQFHSGLPDLMIEVVGPVGQSGEECQYVPSTHSDVPTKSMPSKKEGASMYPSAERK